MDGVRKGLIWGRGQLCRRLANDWLCTNTGYWLELLTAFDTIYHLIYIPNDFFTSGRWRRIQITTTYLYSVGVIIQQQHSWARHLLGLHHRLQISQQAHMFGHVSGQNLNKNRQKKKKESLEFGPNGKARFAFKEEKGRGCACLTMSMTIFRRDCRCFLVRFWKRSQLSSCSSLNPTAKWWFSKTDSSLYISASSESGKAVK